MATHKYYYTIEEFDETIDDASCFSSSWRGRGDCEYIAEDAAEDHFDNHDGWESTWPLTFVLYDEGKNEIGRFLVQQDARPDFHATKEQETPNAG